MGCINRVWARRRWLTAATVGCTLGTLVLLGRPLDAQESTEERPVISWTQAAQYVGKEVTVEGRIVGTHTSPLSTLLSFDEGFNRFTAIIHPADLAAFPPDPEEYYRGKQVRITGRVVEYEKKAEIVLKSRDQIEIVEPKTPTAPGAASKDEATELTLELLRRLTAIETSLENIASQLELILAAVEQQARPEPERGVPLLPGRVPEVEPPPRAAYQALRTLKRGMTTSQVEELMGAPAYVDSNAEGGQIWYYGAGRTISFNPRGRLEAMSGFQKR